MRSDDEDFGDEEPKAAFMGSSSSAKTMADGSLRVTVDLSPADAIGAFTAFGAPGSPVALARIGSAAANEEMQPKVPVKTWGSWAKKLYQSSFFRNPDVWRAVGTDDEYLAWVKRQPSAISGDFSEWHDTGERYCVPAHIRRVENGSGTAIKPPYSAIPLTRKEHDLTHQQGDTSLRPEEWWQMARIKYVHAWCWETAKNQIQLENPGEDYSSFGAIDPIAVEGWALRRNIAHHLPDVYRGPLSGQSKESQDEGST